MGRTGKGFRERKNALSVRMGAGIVERGIMLMGKGPAVMITTSWAGLYDNKKMAVLKAVMFDGVGTDGKWVFLDRELPISVELIDENANRKPLLSVGN